MENRAEWGSLTEEEKKEKRDMLGQQKQHARSFLQLARSPPPPCHLVLGLERRVQGRRWRCSGT